MPKKRVETESSVKTSKASTAYKKEKRENIQNMLIENFVNLQKVLTNLAVKFESLSDQISKLLQLFEISAKSFVEKQSPELGEKEKDKEFLEKLDKLLDQNKTIAKGLTLMEEKLRERIYGPLSDIEEKERPRYPQL